MPRNGHSVVQPVRFLYDAGHSTGEHQHEEHQLVFASYGLLCVDTGTSRWVVPPQRAVWIPANTPHTVTARAATQMSTLYVERTVAIPHLADVAVIAVKPLLRELIHHLFNDEPDQGAHRRVEAVILDQLTVAPTTPLELRQLNDSRLQAIADIYVNDPCDNRTLQDLGEHVGASERTLQRLFHRETGTTFGRWRTQLRLQHAVIAIGSGQSVTAAAHGAGYREPSAFIVAFRKTFGTTPAGYFANAPAKISAA